MYIAHRKTRKLPKNCFSTKLSFKCETKEKIRKINNRIKDIKNLFSKKILQILLFKPTSNQNLFFISSINLCLSFFINTITDTFNNGLFEFIWYCICSFTKSRAYSCRCYNINHFILRTFILIH